MDYIAIAFLACLILALVVKKLSLPPIPFYIMSGIFLGSSGLNIVARSEISLFLSNLGLIFLLFYMGLELKLGRFAEKKSDILIGGFIDMNINMIIGFLVAFLIGFEVHDAIVFASAFYISSSAIAISSLIENKKLFLPESETVVWLMIFEDIILVLIIFLLSAEFANLFTLLLETFVMVISFFGISKFAKGYLFRIMTRGDEIPVLLTFSSVLLVSYFSRLLGVPEALAVIALGSALSTVNSKEFERISKPFKDVFLVLFFFFFGVSMEFTGELSVIPFIVMGLVAVGSKMLSGLAMGRVIHGSYFSGFEIGANSIARGEFSIVIASLYASDLVSAAVTVMVLMTSLIGSFMAKYSFVMRRILKEKVGR
jgi:CPA2 family monovalent cation:H+ antiporter-2